MFCRLSRVQFSKWAESLELKRVHVRIQFEITAEVGVWCILLNFSFLDEQMSPPEVGAHPEELKIPPICSLNGPAQLLVC